MTDWTSGYVANVEYTYGYYPELNPQRVKLAFLHEGLVCPSIGTACELGFGQGLSTNLHAAASVTQWVGTDFNPSQAGFAQEVAAAAGSTARLYDEAFADFARRTDLPDFDFIGLHGIWSWISDENRAAIVDFVRRKLKVGGVLYISYNTLPGWAAFAPVRHLLSEHAKVLGSEGQGILGRVDGALQFAQKLVSVQPAYTRANPLMPERINQLMAHDRHYLAHEYFNAHWCPMHVATLAEWLEPAKVQFAGSATLLDHVPGLNFTTEQLTFLNDIPDAMFRETVRDFIVNQQFRRDYWVKGARKLSALDQAAQLRQYEIILTTPRQDVSMQLQSCLGSVSLTAAIYNPILDALAGHQPRTLGQIEQAVQGLGISLAQISEAAVVLTGAGHAAAVMSPSVTERALARSNALNAHLLQKARTSGAIAYLASPVTGGGVIVPRIQQLFLLALAQGHTEPSAWADAAWQVLRTVGERMLKDGKALESADDNIAELSSQAQVFSEKQLPILRALQIA